MTQRNEYIYIMTDGEDYKIGYAFDVIRRMREIQNGNKLKITILHVINTNDMYTAEKDLKQVLKPFRIRGEWYSIPEYILKALLAIVNLDTQNVFYNSRIQKLHARVKTYQKSTV